MEVLEKWRKYTPVPCPKNPLIDEAVEILGKQRLHIYQLLFYRGLTQPGLNARPLVITRNTTALGILKIEHHSREKGLYFNLRGTETDEEILKKAKLVLDAVGKPVQDYACCAHAVPRMCVCRASFDCELHGPTCVGSHD